jgi:hypothetical protein
MVWSVCGVARGGPTRGCGCGQPPGLYRTKIWRGRREGQVLNARQLFPANVSVASEPNGKVRTSRLRRTYDGAPDREGVPDRGTDSEGCIWMTDWGR